MYSILWKRHYFYSIYDITNSIFIVNKKIYVKSRPLGQPAHDHIGLIFESFSRHSCGGYERNYRKLRRHM